MAIFSIFQFVSVLAFSLFLVGLLNNLFSDTENKCEMTYMFEYPQFVRIKVPENDKHPQYGLYAYSEGRFTERARKMRFNGVPVLFLPGNVGSYKQVRSLASVALRKAISSSRHGFHFDYFTVDFNDERSALFGGILDRQTEFSSDCLQAILNLYNTNFRQEGVKPTSVIVIGHSMGGVIARALLKYSQNREIINLILTLASPHQMPVLNIDYNFDKFYQQIEDQWVLKGINTSDIAPHTRWSSKVLVSIGGGARDLLVPSALTSAPHTDIFALTTSIPGVWLSTDHLCIVWCKQLVLVLNRFLFSIINPNTRQLTDDTSHIVTMGKHFLKIGHSRNASHYNSQADFIPDAVWHEDSRRSYSFTHEKGIEKPHYYMIRLVDLPDFETATLEAVDLEDKDWLFGCQAKYVHGQYRVCMNGRHLSGHSAWAASMEGKRRTATLDLKALRLSYPHWTHIILRVSPTFKKVQVNVDIYRKSSRLIEAHIPGMYNPLMRTVLPATVPRALRYTISLPGLDMLYQAFLLYVEPQGACLEGGTHHATANFSVPWADGHQLYDYFTNTQRSPMRLRLQKGNPVVKNNTQHPTVELTLDPRCTYTVSIAASAYDSLGQLSRHYATSLPSYLGAILLLVLRHWAASMEAPAAAPQAGVSFHSALCGEHVKPYYPILSARMGTMMFMTVPFLAKLTPILKIGVAGAQNFLLLPLFLHVVALGALHILGAACWALLIFSGQLAHKILLRLIAVGRSGGGARVWEWAAGGLRKAPGAGGALLVALATASCGAVALSAGAAFYFFLLTKMYEDYLEDLVYKTIAIVTKKLRGKKPAKADEKSENNVNTEENSTSEIIGDNVNLQKINDKSENTEDAKNNELINVNGDKSDKEIHSTQEISKEAPDETSVISVGVKNKSDLDPVTNVEAEDADKQLAIASNDTPNTENTSESRERKRSENFSLSPLHFHFAMFFVWCLVTILNIPALLTWAHNYKYSKMLDPDPSYIPGLIMCSSAAVLWQIEAPKPNIKYYDILSKLLYFTAVVAMMITPTALYRLNYLLSAIFAIITLHQMFPVEIGASTAASDSTAPETENPETDPSPEQPETADPTAEPPPSQSHKIAASLINEENDLERFRHLKEKLESD